MKAPETIKVGPWTLSVVWDNVACDASGCTGQYLGDVGQVMMSDNAADHILQDTMLHETIHAIWHQAGLKIPYPDEKKNSPGEAIITVLATHLLALLKENPALVEYLVS